MIRFDSTAPSVLVTGRHSSLGAALESALRAAGASRVRRVDPSAVPLHEPAATAELMRAERPDAVVHLAGSAGSLVRLRARPASVLQHLVLGGINVVHAAHEQRVDRVLVLGCSAAYPAVSPVPLDERTLWSGAPDPDAAPLAVAVRTLAEMVRTYALEYELPASFLITGNPYGPVTDGPATGDEVIPTLVRRLARAHAAGNSELTLRGTGRATRDFVHHDDIARGVLTALRTFLPPEPVNLGTGRETSIRDLAARIADQVGYRGAIHWDGTQPDGPPRRGLATARARELLDFETRVSLAAGLPATVAAWRRHVDPAAATPRA